MHRPFIVRFVPAVLAGLLAAGAACLRRRYDASYRAFPANSRMTVR